MAMKNTSGVLIAMSAGLALWTRGTEPRPIFQGYGCIFWFRALSATME